MTDPDIWAVLPQQSTVQGAIERRILELREKGMTPKEIQAALQKEHAAKAANRKARKKQRPTRRRQKGGNRVSGI